MIKNIYALIMIMIFFPTNAMSEKIIFATMPLPPFVYYENDKLTGSDIEIISEVCKNIDIDPQFQVMPFIRLLNDVKKGNIQANFPISYKKERESFLYYPTESYNMRKMIIYTRKGSNLKISKLDDFKDKTIAVVSGYDYGSEFNNYSGIKKEECKNDEDLMKLVIKGRRDFAATEESVAIYTSKQLGFKDEIEIIFTLIEDPLYVTFPKSTGIQAQSLSEKFGKTLRHLKEEGIIQKILKKYHTF